MFYCIRPRYDKGTSIETFVSSMMDRIIKKSISTSQLGKDTHESRNEGLRSTLCSHNKWVSYKHKLYVRKEVLNVPHILLFTGAAKRSFPGGHATDEIVQKSGKHQITSVEQLRQPILDKIKRRRVTWKTRWTMTFLLNRTEWTFHLVILISIFRLNLIKTCIIWFKN